MPHTIIRSIWWHEYSRGGHVLLMGMRGCGLLLLLLLLLCWQLLPLLLLLLLFVGGDRLGTHGGRGWLGGAWWVGLWRDVGTCCRDFTLGHLMRETKGNLSEQIIQVEIFKQNLMLV